MHHSNMLKYFLYCAVAHLKYNSLFNSLRLLNQTQYNTYDELKNIQLVKLKSLLSYAKETVPYYQETLGRVLIEEIHDVNDLHMCPLITKEQIRQYADHLTGKQQRVRSLTKKTTGGSTGESVTIWKSSKSMGHELAATWRGYSWAGIAIGGRQARFWGVPFDAREKNRAKMIDFVGNRKRCSAFSFDDATLANYTKKLERFQPQYFYGYVSMLTAYGEYFVKNGVTPPFKLDCIVSTSEVLTPLHRQFLEETFGARVFNEYGCGELGTIAHECEEGAMHISAENMIVEVLDGDRVCSPGEVGEIVVTELNNYAMPLIRYRLGDFGVLSRQQCLCGRGLPVLEKVKGRAYDIIKTKKGLSFHGEFFMYIFEDAKRKNLGVGGFQVIQKSLSQLHIKIIPSDGYSQKTEQFITERIKGNLGDDTQISFFTVDSISREKSGKMRLIVGM